MYFVFTGYKQTEKNREKSWQGKSISYYADIKKTTKPLKQKANRKSTLYIVIKQMKPLVNPTTAEAIQKKREPLYFPIDEVGSL